MMGFLQRLGHYVLDRLQERSTVAGIVGVAMSLLGIASPTAASTLINGIVLVASAIAMAVPGGK